MANTITVTISVKVSDPSGGVGMNSTDTIPQVGSNFSKVSQLITAATPVRLYVDPNIAEGNLGYLTVRNLAPKVAGQLPTDAPYINVATDANMVNVIMTIPPAISHFIQPPNGTVALWAQAHGADTPATVQAIET